MSNKINEYGELLKNGIIYKCYSKDDDKVYYGSTKDIKQRIQSHNNKTNKTNSNYIVGKLQYEILEQHENITRKDLERKERVYIENHLADETNPIICINKNIPTQTNAEYSAKRYKENCEVIKERQRDYYWNNLEKEKQRLALYYFTNQKKISDKGKNELWFCVDCKASMRKDTKRRHIKTKNHINNMFHKDYSNDAKVI